MSEFDVRTGEKVEETSILFNDEDCIVADSFTPVRLLTPSDERVGEHSLTDIVFMQTSGDALLALTPNILKNMEKAIERAKELGWFSQENIR